MEDNQEEKKKNKGGRPRKEIDQKIFENLCMLQCTEQEILAWFDITDKTLSSWCKRTYGMGFSDTYKAKRGKGKISLRRTQWQLAEKSATMAIWLGKQYLGQSDNPTIESEDDDDTDALSQSLAELAKDLRSD